MSFIWITFTHGLAQPVLFPIAFFALVILYVKEKICYIYLYKQPPMMNNDINEAALFWLAMAPGMMMAFGYW